MQVVDEFGALLRKPKDDWDHRMRRVEFVIDEPTDADRYRINTLHPWNQMMNILGQRYSGTAFAAHGWRWFEIKYFMRRHNARLRREGWVRAGQDSEYTEVHDSLLAALCELRYTGYRGRGEHRQRTFKYSDVVRRAREIAGPGALE